MARYDKCPFCASGVVLPVLNGKRCNVCGKPDPEARVVTTERLARRSRGEVDPVSGRPVFEDLPPEPAPETKSIKHRRHPDTERLAFFVSGRRGQNDDTLIQMTLRSIDGKSPTLNEWRAAIDKAMLIEATGAPLEDVA